MFSNLKGDLFGGLSSAIIALPVALAFGIVAFAPLGPEFASQGALACLYGAILTSFFASLFGGTPTQVTGPTGPMSVMIAAMITASLHAKSINIPIQTSEIFAILCPVFLAVFIAGIFQILLGLSRGGQLIKFIPYPVIAGFMNGVAMIIFFGQVKPFLGLRGDQSVLDVFTGAAMPSWISVVVGIITILAVVMVPRYVKAVPGALMGLAAGLGCFFIIGWGFRPDLLTVEGNPFIIGNIPASLPKPDMALGFMNLVGDLDKGEWMKLLVAAFTLAMLGSIDSLLTSLVADVVTKTRHNSLRELIGQGIGNIVASVFGALPGAGSTVRTLANIQNGGKTRLSGMFCGISIFGVLVFFGKYARYIPYSVLAGILMVVSSRMADSWSFGLIKRKSTLRDMAIVILVAGTTLFVDLMVAVGLGVVITILLFIKDQVSRSVIKNRMLGSDFHSKKVRATDEMESLEKKGHRIVVYQLEGSIFFGTADGLLKEIEKDARDAEILILDLRLVKDIDLTGAQLFRQLDNQLKDEKKHLILSYISNSGGSHEGKFSLFLKDVGVLDQIGDEKLFEDTDRALEWAEDFLLKMDGTNEYQDIQRVDVEDMKIFRYLSKEEISIVSKLLQRSSYNAGDVIFKEGDEGNTMFLVSRGCVSILLDIGKGQRKKRVASFGKGVFFGDMALLEEKPRSATAIAEEDTELYGLTKADFLQLLEETPKIASRIQLGIARELSGRLRSTSDEVRELEL
jgi:SulP family sulfate permease